MIPNDNAEITSQISEPAESASDTLKIAQEKAKKQEKLFDELVHVQRDKETSSIDPSSIEDEDIRYQAACDIAADMLRENEANKIKPGFENYEGLMTIISACKPVITFIITLFIFVSRPEWCTDLGSYIDYQCRNSLDPNYKVTYVRSSLPLLSESIKTGFCLFGMIGISMIELIKTGVTVSSPERRNSFVFCLFLTVVYVILYIITGLTQFTLPCIDLIPVLFIIMSFDNLRKLFLKSSKIIALSRDVIIFFFLFLFVSSVVARILFFDKPWFADAEEPSVFTMNFKSFTNSFVSLSNAIFLIDGELQLFSMLYTDWKVYVLFFVIVGLFRKLILFNFLTANLYSFYNKMFKDDVDFVSKDSFVKNSIKENIILKRLTSKKIETIIKDRDHQNSLNKNIVKIEKFFKVDPAFRTDLAENPDFFGRFVEDLKTNTKYEIFLAFVQFLSIILIILSMQMNADWTITLYSILFVLSFIQLVDGYMKMKIQKFDPFLILNYFDVLSSGVLLATLMIFFMIGDESYIMHLRSENPVIRKLIGILVVSKSGKLLSMLAYNEQIALVFQIFVNSLGFVMNTFGSIIIVMLIYATIGISIFGGNVSSDTPNIYLAKFGGEMDPLYLQLNFNDYYYALLTLFCVMVGGWPGLLTMNTLRSPSTTPAYNMFFMSYFFLSNCCLMNILFGFLVDNVSAYLTAQLSKESEEKQKEKSQKKVESQRKTQAEAKEKEALKKKENMSQDLDNFVGNNRPLDQINENPNENAQE